MGKSAPKPHLHPVTSDKPLTTLDPSVKASLAGRGPTGRSTTVGRTGVPHLTLNSCVTGAGVLMSLDGRVLIGVMRTLRKQCHRPGEGHEVP